MQAKTVLVTGANQGIGKSTAVALARLGFQVTIVARNPDKGRAAIEEIQAASPRGDAESPRVFRTAQARGMAGIPRARCAVRRDPRNDSWGSCAVPPTAATRRRYTSSAPLSHVVRRRRLTVTSVSADIGAWGRCHHADGARSRAPETFGPGGRRPTTCGRV